MNAEEFTREVKKLEAAKSLPIARSSEEIEYRDLRRLAIFELVGEFPVAVFREAVKRICGSDGSDSPRFFPSVDEIVQVCQEVAEENKPKLELPKSKFKPRPHKCGPNAERTPALDLLKRLSPYDARHAECPGEIEATCTVCGAHHINTSIIGGIMKLFPEETKNWNPHFKGLLPCPNCEKQESNS